MAHVMVMISEMRSTMFHFNFLKIEIEVCETSSNGTDHLQCDFSIPLQTSQVYKHHSLTPTYDPLKPNGPSAQLEQAGWKFLY